MIMSEYINLNFRMELVIILIVIVQVTISSKLVCTAFSYYIVFLSLSKDSNLGVILRMKHVKKKIMLNIGKLILFFWLLVRGVHVYHRMFPLKLMLLPQLNTLCK